MKVLLICVLLIMAFNVNGQIVKEKTYTPEMYYDQLCVVYKGIFNNSDGVGYVLTDIPKLSFKLYNLDHSISKESTIKSPTNGSTLVSMFYFTTNFFNNDGKVEFLACWTEKDYSKYYLYLYDEEGNMLYDFGEVYDLYMYGNEELKEGDFYYAGTNKLKLRKPKSSNNTYPCDIYSFGGTYNSLSNLKISKEENAYPNPAKNKITIPYKLKNADKSVLRVYNIDGKMVTQKTIDTNFDNIQLDVTNFSKGTYIYKYQNITDKFVVN